MVRDRRVPVSRFGPFPIGALLPVSGILFGALHGTDALSAQLAEKPQPPRAAPPTAAPTAPPTVAPTAVPIGEWPQWRGPLGTGTAPDADPPVTWSDTKNIRFRVEVPGLGYGTPIVVGDRVFVTSAVPWGETVPPVPDDAPGAHDNAPLTQRQEFVALAFARRDGRELWRTTLRRHLPHAGAHRSASLASASPVADREHLIVSFGSSGLFCLDHGGKQVWEVDLGDMHVKHGHGEGSSPVLHGDTVVVNWDHEGPSFLVALDKRTGKPRWRVPRDEVTSWATPIVVEDGGRTLVVVSGTKRIRAYDLRDGKEIWQCGGLSQNVVASPVAGSGIVVAASSYEKRAALAIRLSGATGDITTTDHVLWRKQHRTPYVPSPLLYEDRVYYLNHYQGVLSRLRLQTGEEDGGPLRLAGMFDIYASPVAAAGRIYITDRDGMTLVLSHGKGTPGVLAVNRLSDSFSASAALAGRELYLRGAKHLYCIAATEPIGAGAPARVR